MAEFIIRYQIETTNDTKCTVIHDLVDSAIIGYFITEPNQSNLYATLQVASEACVTDFTIFETKGAMITMETGQFKIMHETSKTYANQIVIDHILFDNMEDLVEYTMRHKCYVEPNMELYYKNRRS